MLKPGEAGGGSAFLKVDPAYLQHWQQLFPHGSGPLKAAGVLAQPPPPPEPPADSLRPRPAPLPAAASSAPAPAPAALPAFAPLRSAESPPGPEPHGKDSCAAGGERPAPRPRCTAEELDYYLYGQQRMEIIPLNQHTSDPNSRTYPRAARAPCSSPSRAQPSRGCPGRSETPGAKRPLEVGAEDKAPRPRRSSWLEQGAGLEVPAMSLRRSWAAPKSFPCSGELPARAAPSSVPARKSGPHVPSVAPGVAGSWLGI